MISVARDRRYQGNRVNDEDSTEERKGMKM